MDGGRDSRNLICDVEEVEGALLSALGVVVLLKEREDSLASLCSRAAVCVMSGQILAQQLRALAAMVNSCQRPASSPSHFRWP